MLDTVAKSSFFDSEDVRLGAWSGKDDAKKRAENHLGAAALGSALLFVFHVPSF
jgi:hypothetical protein